MRSDYGNLRRRTRDSSWQWLFMGLILGIGLSAVVCVGGYAFKAISFPILDSTSDGTNVQIEPNQTEVAMQATVLNQTITAQSAMTQTQSASMVTAENTPILTAEVTTPTPSQLPNSAAGTTTNQTPAATNLPGGNPIPTATSGGQVAAMGQDTPVVGTPLNVPPTQTISFLSAPQLPPELDAIKTSMQTITGGTFSMGTTQDEALQAVDECALYESTCDLADAGDSTPPHSVIVDTFQMEIYEVTASQYAAFLNWLGPNSHKNKCNGQPCIKTTTEEENSYIAFDGTTYTVRNPEFYSDHPVTWVTWWGAEAYCEALNRRLPTEAEWERAARGDQNFTYPWGFEYDLLRANSSRPREAGATTEAVDSYPNGTSPYGIYNLAGNVSEWVSDWYVSNYYSQIMGTTPSNPQGPPTGTEKVHRGGNWDTTPFFLRTVHRLSARPDEPSGAIGFRCVSDGPGAAVPVAVPANPGGATNTPGGPTIPPAPTRPAGPTATLAPG